MEEMMKNKQKAQKNYLQTIMAELEWFYRETGITITVFDRKGNPIAHCGGGVDICRYIKFKLYKKCSDCDKAALMRLLNGDRCEYLCHAGLSEAAALVRSEDGDFDGYIIIGKYLAEETLEASKTIMQKLSEKDVNLSAVRRAAETLIPLSAEKVDHALCCLSAVARRLEETGCLKGFRNPDVRHAIQMVNRDRQKATCTALYGEIHVTRQSANTIFVQHCGEIPNDTSRGPAHEYKCRRERDLRTARVRSLRLYNLLQAAMRGYARAFPKIWREGRRRKRKANAERRRSVSGSGLERRLTLPLFSENLITFFCGLRNSPVKSEATVGKKRSLLRCRRQRCCLGLYSRPLYCPDRRWDPRLLPL